MNSRKQRKLRIDWRRSQILELSSKGHNQSEIARILQVDKSIVCRDITELREQSKQQLQFHLDKEIPFQYNRILIGVNQVLDTAWNIANGGNNVNYLRKELNMSNINNYEKVVGQKEDQKTKLQALALVIECYKFTLDLVTNGSIVSDAIKFVNQKNKEHLKQTASAAQELTNDELFRESDPPISDENDSILLKTSNHIF